MAAKKRARRKRTPVKPPPRWREWRRGRRECKDKDICAYLTELGEWLELFYKDYQALRIAVCNVEARAFDGMGTNAKRFCKGGGPGDDPADPPKPPIWT